MTVRMKECTVDIYDYQKVRPLCSISSSESRDVVDPLGIEPP
jgi:hypothetical protein